MRRIAILTSVLLLGAVVCPIGGLAASKKEKEKDRDLAAQSSAPTTFAPLPEGHPLLPSGTIRIHPAPDRQLWLLASEAEPRMTPEEQAIYRDKVVPLLRDNPSKATETLEGLAKPNASAVFDFTLGNVAFQNEDLTNAVKHFESALAKFPDYRRAQKNLAFALVRDGKFREAITPLFADHLAGRR